MFNVSKINNVMLRTVFIAVQEVLIMKTAFRKYAAILMAILATGAFATSASADTVDNIPNITTIYDYSYIPDIPVEVNQAASVSASWTKPSDVDLDSIPDIKTQTVIAYIPDMPYVEIGNTLLGDVDGDGALTSADALAVLRLAVYEGDNTALHAAADIDGDGEITSFDAVEILRRSNI